MSRGRHAKPVNRRGPLTAAAIVPVLATLVGSALLTQPAQASTGSLGNRILDRAETRTGDWYVYGAKGPANFDCSGLVAWAAAASGEKNWPRSTFDIARLIGKRFEVVTTPERGDLALWGPLSAPYHVEFVTRWGHTTFGAQKPGTRVDWHYNYPGWRPDFYLRILY